MTGPEWAMFMLELEATFKGKLGPDSNDDAAGVAQETVFVRHFAGEPQDVMLAAVALLVQDGQVWMPLPGDLASALRRVRGRSVVPFAEVMREFDAAVRRRRLPQPHQGRDVWAAFERGVVEDVGNACGEGAARWVATRSARLLCEEQRVGEWAGPVADRLSKELAEFVGIAREDGRVGVALSRAGMREVGAGGGLRRLAPVDASGVLEIEAAPGA